MRVALLIVATLAFAAAYSPEGEFLETVTGSEVGSVLPKQSEMVSKEADFVLRQEEREELFAAASSKVEMTGLIQAEAGASTGMKKAALTCHTSTRGSNNAGVVYATAPGGYQMTGGGMVNNYRAWNAKAGFEEAFPYGNHFRCDTGFGPGRLTCYNRSCKTNVGGLQCTNKSLRFRGSGVRQVAPPAGYTMTGGGLYNHYRGWNARAGFEESRPNGNAWRGDMGFGWGDYTVYVRGCKAPKGHTLQCVTRHSGIGNYMRTPHCPAGYVVTGCGINNHYRHWNKLSGFEAMFPKSNTQCDCDSGFGSGRNRCFARCCKIAANKPVGLASCTSNAHKAIKDVVHEVKNAQSILNKMDNGSRCASKGQSAINNAKASLQRKQAAVKQAQKELNKANNARVSVSVTFSSGNRNCNVFTSSAAWQRARRNKNRKQNALTKAKQQVNDANKYLAKMQAQAIRDQCKCKDRVTKAAKNAVAQARKLTAERKRTIIRELMVICLANAAKKKGAAANNAGNRCKSQGLPSKYNSQLNLHQTKLVKMNFKCAAALEAGKFACRYGYCYRTLGNFAINGPSSKCDNTYKMVPKGCHIAPDNSHSHTMAKAYSWSTSVLVFSNGYAWGSRTYGSNRFYGNGRWLSTSHRSGRLWAKTNGCTLAVLLRCSK